MIKVLVVDDHPLIVHGLITALSASDDIEVVGEAPDGQSAVRSALRLHPDVITMELDLPDMSGLVVTERIIEEAEITANGWSPQIIILTSSKEDKIVIASIQAGACGYLLKSSPLQDIVMAIRDVGEGRSVLTSSVTGALVRQVRRTVHAHELSAREYDVLRLVAQGLTNNAIARLLVVKPSTVKTHLEHIYKKMDASCRMLAVTRAREYGFIV